MTVYSAVSSGSTFSIIYLARARAALIIRSGFYAFLL